MSFVVLQSFGARQADARTCFYSPHLAAVRQALGKGGIALRRRLRPRRQVKHGGDRCRLHGWVRRPQPVQSLLQRHAVWGAAASCKKRRGARRL